MKTWFSLLTMIFLLSFTLAGCVSMPEHPKLVEPGKVLCDFGNDANVSENCKNITPEISKLHELHFVEFDDQGWLFDLKNEENENAVLAKKRAPCARTDGLLREGENCFYKKTQIDHLMERLTNLIVKDDQDLSIVLYVHGWKHDSTSEDDDVKKFRQLVAAMGRIEAAEPQPRKVVGIYVGWHGKSWLLPGITQNLSFWSRKNAALRVSNNSAKELFARLRAIQRFYNDKSLSKECGPDHFSAKHGDRCKIRTLMVGHSFGAWILYSAVSGPMIASLSAHHDRHVSKNQLAKLSSDDAKRITEILNGEKAERMADMVILINPAFEGSRYESLYQAAKLYTVTSYEPPMLVTITSTADWATKNTFPIGRFFNTLFEFPISSEEQKVAMRRTPGNIDHYLTHRLSGVGEQQDTNSACAGWIWPKGDRFRTAPEIEKNKEIETGNDIKFFQPQNIQNGLLVNNWKRNFCGGVTLEHFVTEKNVDNSPNSLVWNIRTDKSLIRDHNDIMQDQFVDFLRQLYADTLPRGQTQTPGLYSLGN